jgi:putative ABC transport system permease protein
VALTTLLRRLHALVHRSRLERDLEEEMRLHVDLRTEQLRGGGVTEGDARAAARRRFGSTLRLREEGADAWGWRWLEQLAQDVHFAARMLGRQPGFAATAIVTLGLGIGANTAIFSALNGVVLKPLPYTNGERLVIVRQSAAGIGVADAGVSVREYYDYLEQARSFDALVEYHQMFFDLLRRGAPDRVNVGVVDHNFFPVLGIEPLLGRDFTSADDESGADAVLMLSYSYWMTRFGGDPRIVGQVFEMNDRPHTVVGVLPNVPHYPQENDVYMPVASCPFRARAEEDSRRSRRAFQILNAFGRLKPGVSQRDAAREIQDISTRFSTADRVSYPSAARFAAAAPLLRDELARDAEPLLLLLLGATGMILLIACANVANLMLARLLQRDRELGMREALGAGRGRLVRQLLTESTLLSLMGGGVGLLVAASTLSLLTSFIARFTSRTGEIAIDGWVLAFTMIVSVATGAAFGSLAALLSKFDLGTIVRIGHVVEGRLRRRLQRGLVVAQIAVSVVLLIAAGLLLASFYRLQSVDGGYDAEQVVTAEAFVTFARYPDPEKWLALYDAVLNRLRAEPGVIAAAIASALPLDDTQPNMVRFIIEGQPAPHDDLQLAEATIASPDYFVTMGVMVVDGRPFEVGDRRGAAAVAMVNETLAQRWPGRTATGSRISLNGGKSWFTVVGVARDVRQTRLDRDVRPAIYLPLGQGPAINSHIMVRVIGDTGPAGRAITRAVHDVDPDLPIENVATLAAIRSDHLSRPQLTALLLTIFAALALAVTVTGIAGVMAMHVSRRRTEFGVRMALGATPGQVLRPVLANGMKLVASGLVLGLVAAAAVTRVLSAYLFQTTPTDPAAFAVVALALVCAGGAACALPAWRATRVEPQVVFRTD